MTVDEFSEDEILSNCRTLKQRRDARMKFRQNIAMINYSKGLVGGRSGADYAAANEIRIRNEQKRRTREWANGHWVYDYGSDALLNLGMLMSRAGSQQFAELFTIATGIQKHAEAMGLVATFVTLTAPAQMHPNPKKGRNQWDGTSPRQAQAWIARRWHQVLARLKKAKIEITGLRVVEPHKDGCPHWHLMIWSHAEDVARIEEIIQKAAPSWSEEAGAKFVRIDASKGKATTYLFKYLTKSIGSLGELVGANAAIDAWRACWGIRAFQFFGIPSLKDWRNFRKLKTAPSDPLLAGAWYACKRGDAQAWIGLSGGLCVSQKDRPIKTEVEVFEDFKYLTIINKANFEIKEEMLTKWEIVDEAKKTEIERELNLNENHIVAVIPNDPRAKQNPPQFLFDDDLDRIKHGENILAPPSFMPQELINEIESSFGAVTWLPVEGKLHLF